jgi:hypothetical protein
VVTWQSIWRSHHLWSEQNCQRSQFGIGFRGTHSFSWRHTKLRIQKVSSFFEVITNRVKSLWHPVSRERSFELPVIQVFGRNAWTFLISFRLQHLLLTMCFQCTVDCL